MLTSAERELRHVSCPSAAGLGPLCTASIPCSLHWCSYVAVQPGETWHSFYPRTCWPSLHRGIPYHSCLSWRSCPMRSITTSPTAASLHSSDTSRWILTLAVFSVPGFSATADLCVSTGSQRCPPTNKGRDPWGAPGEEGELTYNGPMCVCSQVNINLKSLCVVLLSIGLNGTDEVLYYFIVPNISVEYSRVT